MKILLVRTKRIPQAITLSDIMFAEPVGLEIIYGVLEKGPRCGDLRLDVRGNFTYIKASEI